MGIDHAQQRFCDNCGRTIDKAVRVHRGADYCRSCYQRTFMQKPCSVCAATTRVHRHDEEPPVCPACVRATRLCARCGKACPRAGKLLGSTKEAVCPACVPRVSEPQPCPRCKEPSTRLSRPFTGLLDPVCDRCRNALTHGTCVTCRRYRKVAGHLPNDMPYCASCVPVQPITHPCPGCGQEVPGNGVGRCQNCGTRDLVLKDAAEHALTLAPWVCPWWQDFVESQLTGERLSPQLRARMNRAADFFRILGERFSSIDAMDTQSVLRMGSSTLRQHLLASRFVFTRLEELGESTKKDAVQARVAMVEQERLLSVLDDAESAPYAAALLAYTQALSWQSVAVRTIRMYVRAAERFCAQVPFDGVSPWSADDLLRYLSACPGQGASLARFVSHCRAAYGWDVAMPSGRLWKSKKTKAQKDFDAFKRVWRHTAQEGRCAMSTKVLAISFGRSFGVSAAHMLRQREEHGAPRTADGSIMVLPDAVIGVRHPMYPLALRWADLADRLADRRRRRMQRP